MLADSGITNEYKWIIMPAEIIVKTEKNCNKKRYFVDDYER